MCVGHTGEEERGHRLACERVSFKRMVIESATIWDIPTGAGNFLPSIDILCREIENERMCRG